MGYRLTDKAIEGLQRVFHADAITKISSKLESCDQGRESTVRITVDINFNDFGRVISVVTFVFAVGTEVLPIKKLDLNKWLPIEKINHHVLNENVIFKHKLGDITMHNVGELDTSDNTILCTIDNNWYTLDNVTHFMVFKQ